MPVKKRTGIGLPIGRDVGMTAQGFDRVVSKQCGEDDVQRFILRIGERFEIGSFEFDTDRKVIARGAAIEFRHAGVPGAVGERNELRQRAVALDEEVRRHARARDLRKIGIGSTVERVGEQPRDVTAAITAGRQTDVVNDDQLDRGTRRPRIEIRRFDAAHAIEPAVGANHWKLKPFI